MSDLSSAVLSAALSGFLSAVLDGVRTLIGKPILAAIFTSCRQVAVDPAVLAVLDEEIGPFLNAVAVDAPADHGLAVGQVPYHLWKKNLD